MSLPFQIILKIRKLKCYHSFTTDLQISQASKNVLLRMEGEIVGSTTSAGARKRS